MEIKELILDFFLLNAGILDNKKILRSCLSYIWLSINAVDIIELIFLTFLVEQIPV